MLTNGSMILVREEGDRRPVESLQISDFIFDPIADKYCEIIDILSREIRSEWLGEKYEHPLRPVVLDADLLGPGRPTHQTIVSPSQPILTVQSSNTLTTPMTANVTAASLATRSERLPRNFLPESAAVTYFALFTTSQQLLDVQGLLMQTYSQDVFQEPLRPAK